MFKLFSFLVMVTFTFVSCSWPCPPPDSCTKTPKPEDCLSGELLKYEIHHSCCPPYKTCASAEGETCLISISCATGLECKERRCSKKNDCEVIKKKIAWHEENLQDLLASATKVLDDLTRMKAENQKCFACLDPKPEYPD